MGLCLRKLDPFISQEPARINAGLYAAAEGLRLADLTSAMRVICDKIRNEMRVDPEKVRRITEGLIALIKLGSDLAALAREHDWWQNPTTCPPHRGVDPFSTTRGLVGGDRKSDRASLYGPIERLGPAHSRGMAKARSRPASTRYAKAHGLLPPVP